MKKGKEKKIAEEPSSGWNEGQMKQSYLDHESSQQNYEFKQDLTQTKKKFTINLGVLKGYE